MEDYVVPFENGLSMVAASLLCMELSFTCY